MPYNIVRDNIVNLKVDAIVNAANSDLIPGAGVCGAIFLRAGMEKMMLACEQIGYCATGNAVITDGFDLPAKYVIHAVGPIYNDGKSNEESLLYDTYKNSLLLAKANNINSIAFPLISSGIYGFPKDKALSVATRAIGDFLLENDMNITLVIYDKESYRLSKKVFSVIETFLDENFEYVRENFERNIQYLYTSKKIIINESSDYPRASLAFEDLEVEESFSEMLLRLIDEKGKTDVEVYKKANIDRKLFSKIRTNKSYTPKKQTIIAFAISLELSLDETKDLLQTAGYALSHSQKFDLIIEFFINEKNYNIFDINEALFAFDQPLLGV